MDNIKLGHDFATQASLERVWERVSASIAADEVRSEFRLLTDEDLTMVAAAGDPTANQGDTPKPLI